MGTLFTCRSGQQPRADCPHAKAAWLKSIGNDSRSGLATVVMAVHDRVPCEQEFWFQNLRHVK
jgi:hypothetical protein